MRSAARSAAALEARAACPASRADDFFIGYSAPCIGLREKVTSAHNRHCGSHRRPPWTRGSHRHQSTLPLRAAAGTDGSLPLRVGETSYDRYVARVECASTRAGAPRRRARARPSPRRRSAQAHGASRYDRAGARLPARAPALLGNGAGLSPGKLRRNRPELRPAGAGRRRRGALRAGAGRSDRLRCARGRGWRRADRLRSPLARHRFGAGRY